MIRTRNQEKFEGYQKDLWGYLKKILKESNPKECSELNNFLLKTKKSMEPVELMEKTLRNISPYIDNISRKDEFIFTPEFGNSKTKPLQFFPQFDFRKVWAKRDLSKENKRIIFRYLELIYINASLALNRNREKVNELVEAIKMEQEIAKEAEENPNAFGDADQASSGSGGLDFNSLFGNDNVIVDLIQDLKNEFNLEEMLGEVMGGGAGGMPLQAGQNPMQLLQNMSTNPQMQDVMKNIFARLETKIKEKGITPEDIAKSTDNVKDNLLKHVAKMPGGSHLKKMLNNLDVDKMMQQLQANGGMGGMGGMGGVPGGDGMNPALANMMKMMQQGMPEGQRENPQLQEMMKILETLPQTLAQDSAQDSHTPHDKSTCKKEQSVSACTPRDTISTCCVSSSSPVDSEESTEEAIEVATEETVDELSVD